MAFGYKDMTQEEYEEAIANGITLEALDKHLNFVSIIALSDPIRPDIK